MHRRKRGQQSLYRVAIQVFTYSRRVCTETSITLVRSEFARVRNLIRTKKIITCKCYPKSVYNSQQASFSLRAVFMSKCTQNLLITMYTYFGRKSSDDLLRRAIAVGTRIWFTQAHRARQLARATCRSRARNALRVRARTRTRVWQAGPQL